VPQQRDVQAFDERAGSYESGRLGQFHRDLADRAVRYALAVAPSAERVLDVGSGTGYALRQLAAALPEAKELTGVDAAPEMVRVAREASGADGTGDGLGESGGGGVGERGDGRVRFVVGTAEELPVPDASVDLVISTTSFDHWQDQAAGLAECARVLVPGGHLVLSDLFSVWLWPTLLGSRRGKARTRGRANRLIAAAGLREPRWHRLAGPIVATVTATKLARGPLAQDERARRASDRAKIDDSSQPRMVARFSHHCMKVPSATCGSGYQLARWSRLTSGTTVSMAYSTGLKQRTSPSPQASTRPWPALPLPVSRPLVE